MSGSKCCFLTCIQISQEADQVVWYSHLFQNFPQFTVENFITFWQILSRANKKIEFYCDLVALPCLFNLYVEYIMRNTGLEEAQAGIKIAKRNINNLRYADDTTLMQKVKRNSKAS